MIALRNWSVHARPQSYGHDEPGLRAKVEDARARIAENALMAWQQQPVVPRQGPGCRLRPMGRADGARVRRRVRRRAVGCAAVYRDLSTYNEQP